MVGYCFSLVLITDQLTNNFESTCTAHFKNYFGHVHLLWFLLEAVDLLVTSGENGEQRNNNWENGEEEAEWSAYLLIAVYV